MASSFNKKEMLDTLIKENQLVIETLNQKFLTLSKAQLNKKPAPKKWSINEIFQHLLVAEEVYLNQFDVIKQKWQESNKSNFESNWFGDLFTHIMSPKENRVKYKMPAPKVVDPKGKFEEKNAEPHKVTQILLENHKKWDEYMKLAYHKELENIKFKVAVPFFKLKLGDVFRVNTAHAKRHLIQAENCL